MSSSSESSLVTRSSTSTSPATTATTDGADSTTQGTITVTPTSTSPLPSRIIGTITETTVVSISATTTSNPKSTSHLSSGTLAGLIIGGLFAGMIIGVMIWLLWIVILRRRRQREPVVRTKPDERLRHLEMMRGQPAPPLREPMTIQMLPPSKNIRILNWLARTRGAGPSSISRRTTGTSENTHVSFVTPRDMVSRSDSLSSPSHHSQPSIYPFGSEAHSRSSMPLQQEQAITMPRRDTLRTSKAQDYELIAGERPASPDT